MHVLLSRPDEQQRPLTVRVRADAGLERLWIITIRRWVALSTRLRGASARGRSQPGFACLDDLIRVGPGRPPAAESSFPNRRGCISTYGPSFGPRYASLRSECSHRRQDALWIL